MSSCLFQQRTVLSHGWKLTGGRVTGCVGMKYSSLLLQFYLYFISYFLTLSLILGRPLNTTHHFQTRIHDSVLVQNSSKNSECGSSCSTHKVWGLLIKNEASVEGVAPELFPMKKMRYNLYVLSTG